MSEPVRVLNMTRLFNKELLIYSFFDIKLKKPARVVFLGYSILLLALIAVPLVLVFGVNPYSVCIGVIVSISLASLVSKPIWGGKKFFTWLKCQIRYIFAPKYYYDRFAGKKLQSYDIDFEVVISRRRDYIKLVKLQKGEK